MRGFRHPLQSLGLPSSNPGFYLVSKSPPVSWKIPVLRSSAAETWFDPCACRKSNPGILVVQPTEDGLADNPSCGVDDA